MSHLPQILWACLNPATGDAEAEKLFRFLRQTAAQDPVAMYATVTAPPVEVPQELEDLAADNFVEPEPPGILEGWEMEQYPDLPAPRVTRPSVLDSNYLRETARTRVMRFGKYGTKRPEGPLPLWEVFEQDAGYLEWCHENVNRLDPLDRQIIEHLCQL